MPFEAAGDAEFAIVLDEVSKSFGAVRAVDNLTLAVRRGEIFGLLGPNGAGKTTTVEMLEGYQAPDHGRIAILGLDPVRDAERLRPAVGIMLQEGGLYPGLRAREVLRLFASYYADSLPVDELLTRVGLTDASGRMVRRLSGGERQRLSLACALVGRPEVLLLDEPTAGMDPQARGVTWTLIREVVAEGATVIVTTHLLDEAERLCDRVAIVTAGSLAALGTPRELTAHSGKRDVRFTTAAPIDLVKLANALAIGADAMVEVRPQEYCLRRVGTPALIADLTAFLRDDDVALSTLDAGRRSLEEVFLQLVSEEGRP